MTPVATLGADPVLDARTVHERTQAAFASGRTRPLSWRLDQLLALGRLLVEREDELVAALAADLGKPPFEAWASDLRATGREIEKLHRELPGWLGRERRGVPWVLRPGRAEILREPKGVVLVIAPWNYPVHLLLTPLAAALSAGNAAVCKPSEVAPATSAALARLVPEYLDPEAVAVVEGGVAATTALLEQRWDHIVYTGNGTVGRIVAAAAARNLTPVTLELGGRTPAIVDPSANLSLAAARVAFGKFLNAGQTCLAVDHAYVHRSVEDEFLDLLTRHLRRRYGRDPRTSPDLARIVNEAHTVRIQRLLAAGGFDVVCGGEVDVPGRYVAPTVLRGVSPDAAILGAEIFGPVLPVISFDDVSEPISAIRSGDKPLALYLFTRDDTVTERVLAETSSGGACVNDAVSHIVTDLPFGGVGQSGYGAYHGRFGFEELSHRKGVYRRPSWVVDAPMLRPPYAGWKQRLARRTF